MDHVEDAALVTELNATLSRARHDLERVEVAIFPSTTLGALRARTESDETGVVYGGQNLSP